MCVYGICTCLIEALLSVTVSKDKEEEEEERVSVRKFHSTKSAE